MHDHLNPYAPPQAIADVPVLADRPGEERQGSYYAVTPLKVVLYSLSTLGIYELYWMYRQWKAVRDRSGEDISPFWRMWFAIFYSGRLFASIRLDAAELGVAGTTSTGLLNAVFVVATLIGSFGNRLSGAAGNVWFLSFLSVVPIAIMQGEINRYLARAAPEHDRNAGFGAGGVVLVVFGALLWMLILVGIFMPPQPEAG